MSLHSLLIAIALVCTTAWGSDGKITSVSPQSITIGKNTRKTFESPIQPSVNVNGVSAGTGALKAA